MDLFPGLVVSVKAANTKPNVPWEIVDIYENKKGNTEVVVKHNSKTRTLFASSVIGVHKNMANQIVSESVEQVGTVMGCPMMVEDIKYMPYHERRGRKPRNED